MAGALGQQNPQGGIPGNLWNTNAQGLATPQAGRPAMTGGLQPLAMLQAYRAGANMDQLQAMNPYTARPTQFLPEAMPATHYAPQVAPAPSPWFGGAYSGGYNGNQFSGGPGGGVGVGGSGGNAAAASSDSGQDGSSAAVGGGDGGGGGGGSK